MKKTVFLSTVLVLCLCLLTACSCKHEWEEASCSAPRTCKLCQETEGEALGHSWAEATCAAPKTCTVCNATEGEALGHNWAEATCEKSKFCTVCEKTEGNPLEHDWKSADCESPKTCSLCGKINGDAIGHAWEDATCEEPKTCTNCGKTEGEALGHVWFNPTCEKPQTCYVCKKTEGLPLGHNWKGAVNMYGIPGDRCGCGEFRPVVSSWTPLTRIGIVADSNDADKFGNYTDIQIGKWNSYIGTHKEALKFWVVDREGYSSTEHITFDTAGNYETLSGIIAPGDDCEKGATMKVFIYLDDKLAYESDSLSYKSYATFTIDVSNTKHIRVVCTASSSQFAYCVVSASLY